MTRLKNNITGFFSRWLRRKLDKKNSEEKGKTLVISDDFVKAKQTEVDELSLPDWQRKDFDPDIKKQLLNSLFRQTEFNNLDGLNDYDDDFTTFPNLGSVITEEMHRMLRLAEGKKHTEAQLPTQKTVVQVNRQETTPDIDENNNDEDNKLA